MKLSITEVSSSQFTWVKKSKVFAAEWSDFKGRDLTRRVYDDACDVGFNMKSERTGKVETFVHSEDVYVGEGEDKEFAYSVFVPADLKLMDLGVKVHIYND